MLTSTTTIPAVTNEVKLDHNSVYSEMALLAKEVYGPQAPLTHKREPLTYEIGYNPAYSENVGNAALGRGWDKVSNLELGIPASDVGLSLNGLHYSFVNGFYQAYNDNDVIKSTNSPDIPEANALILKGIVGGKTTLAVVFRGTDQLADVTDYEDFVTQHYAKFAPLTNALQEYATKGGFEQVVLDGHSLGAAMAQIFAHDLSSKFPAQQIQLFTFGLPGAEKLAPEGVNQINFVNTHDIVPQSGLLSQNPDATIAAANILSINSFLAENILQLLFFQALASVASTTKPKFSSGTTVLLNTSIGTFPSLSEHDLGGDKGGEINPEFPYINKAFNPG
ncbi:MAG: lipase family protein, partial [Dolichospermum sp.]